MFAFLTLISSGITPNIGYSNKFSISFIFMSIPSFLNLVSKTPTICFLIFLTTCTVFNASVTAAISGFVMISALSLASRALIASLPNPAAPSTIT